MTGSDSFIKAGWVHDMRLHTYKSESGETRYVVIGKVKHSQRMSATPLVPWFAAEKSGEILAAHCTCMAGLGEACTHVAALMSSVMKANQLRKVSGFDACTSKKCAWLPANRNVSAAQVKCINFSKPSTNSCKKPRTESVTTPPTSEELAAFHASLRQVPARPVVHLVMDEYAHEFIPSSATDKYPKALSSLYDSNNLDLTYPQLLQTCVAVADSIKITTEQCRAVEEGTRGQASSKFWFTQRAGRITASIFKSAARTNPAMPSATLIKRVCYPEAFRFSTAASRWGCDHEKEARGAYCCLEGHKHEDLVVKDCGLYISPKHPFVGASPDGLLHCKCCQPRLLEVKCPYCVRDGLPSTEMPQSLCMEKRDGHWQLKNDHQYYYQVQCQLNVCDVERAVFVLWTRENITVQEIPRDRTFFDEALLAVKSFFVIGVLPELIGKWLSRKPVQSLTGTVQVPEPVDTVVDDSENETDRLWCFCEKPSFGQMIKCDHKKCGIIWFHMDCLLIRVPPKGKWFCPHCRKLPKYSDAKKKPQRDQILQNES